jgi:hypothetical protein
VYINQAEYGNQESEVLVPIASVPNWLPRTQGNYLKYQVQVDGRTVVGLDTSSMVLSDATISGNQYLVPAGEKRMFTLMTFITVPTTELISPETSVSLSITDLPLTIRTKFNLSL